MKKKSVINLIKYYSEENDIGFRNEAYEIANEFDKSGDHQLAEYIIALMSNANVFVPQMNESDSALFEKLELSADSLWLPEPVMQDILGIVHATSHKVGINKFLFQGAPGTGKTEAVKQLARILNRDIYMVDFTAIIDSKLGQTQKNISSLFKEINNFTHLEKLIILFDEIDAIALDRTNANDLREMGRVTSSMLKGMDYMDERVILVATTNLYEHFDNFRRLYYAVNNKQPNDLKELQSQKFTIREIEILSKIPKSTVARELKEKADE